MYIWGHYFEIPLNLFKIPEGLPVLNTTTFYYILFALIVFLASLCFKKTARALILLVADLVFLYSFGIQHLIVALTIAIIGYIFSYFVKKKWVIYVASFVLVCLLIYFKVFSSISPLGISFYIFKVLSYLVDIERKNVHVEKNILFYLNYVLFFPCITAGPINRSEKFFNELRSKSSWEYVDRKNGGFQLMYGIFEKLVFCDYISSIISNFLSLETTGLTLLIGIFLYSFQIYLDFDSYSNISIGTARLLGFHLDKNFNSPYLAFNLKDFWRKWHISLSSCLRDYIYIPLGGNRYGTFRKYLNLIIVFIISALWHGITLNYLLWGLLHGFIQVIEDLFEKATNLNKINFLKPLRILFNFVIVSLLWLIFRQTDISTVPIIFKNLFMPTSTSLFPNLTINEIYWLLLIIVIVIITDIIRTNIDVLRAFNTKWWMFTIRWPIYIIMIIVFLVFGMYGGNFESSDFIYRWF